MKSNNLAKQIYVKQTSVHYSGCDYNLIENSLKDANSISKCVIYILMYRSVSLQFERSIN